MNTVLSGLGLQQLIGAALVDDGVRAALLSDPLSLATRFNLTVPERRFVAGFRARDLEHFAACVESWCADPAARHRGHRGTAAIPVRLAG